MRTEAAKTGLLITGMRDNACREAVAEALLAVRGVTEVHVNLYRASATIIHLPPCVPADLTAAVGRAGFGAMLVPNGRNGEGDKANRTEAAKETPR